MSVRWFTSEKCGDLSGTNGIVIPFRLQAFFIIENLTDSNVQILTYQILNSMKAYYFFSFHFP